MKRNSTIHKQHDRMESVWTSYNFDEDLERTTHLDITRIHDKYISQYTSGKQPSTVKILDAGCGMGRLLRYYSAKGYNIYGVEVLEELVRRIKMTFPILKVEHASVLDLPFQEANFDIYISVGVLRWIDPPIMNKVFDEAFRVLKPDGILLLDSCCKTYMFDALDWLKEFIGRKERLIEHRVSLDTLRLLCSSAGFQVIELKADLPGYYIGWLARIPIVRTLCLVPTGNSLAPFKLKSGSESLLRHLMKTFDLQSGNFYLIARKP